MTIARRLTIPIILLAAVAASAGLLRPSVYRDTAWVIPQNRGQDLVTLLALAALAIAAFEARRGSLRAKLIWLGLLGYVAYTYTGAAFAYAFNELFLVYVALFGLSGAALIAGLSSLDTGRARMAFDEGTPRRGVIAYLAIMALMLCVLWLSQIIPFLTDGTPPELMVLANTPTVFVYVLDLGIVVPLSLVSAWWLWRDEPWGYVLAGFVLVKSATMGLALLSMTLFAARAAVRVDVALAGVWVALAAAGLSMSWWYFRHCRTTG
jgi:hypothetical protein